MPKGRDHFDLDTPLYHVLPELNLAKEMGVSEKSFERLGSGLGWALQKNSEGKVVRAFHWADMNDWRADVAIDLENK